MAKFKVGDKVKVVAIVGKYQGWTEDYYYAEKMDSYYHQVGTVSELYNQLDHGYKGCFVEFQDGVKWSYPQPSLKKVKPPQDKE